MYLQFGLLIFYWGFLHQCTPGSGFSGGSYGKESTCNSGDQCFAMGQEDPLEKGRATHSNILAWKILWTEDLVGYSPWVTNNWTWLSDSHLQECFLTFLISKFKILSQSKFTVQGKNVKSPRVLESKGEQGITDESKKDST